MTEAVRVWQQATSARPLPSAMATHYNHDRVAVAGDIKTRLLMAVTQLVRRQNSAEVTWDRLRNSYTWEEMCRWKLPTFVDDKISDASSPCAHEVPDAAPQEEVTDSGSSSTSDSETEIDPTCLEWFKQSRNGKTHILQKLEGSALIPWCRSSAFSAHHAERGSGVEPGCDWCTACIQRAPLSVSRCLQGQS